MKKSLNSWMNVSTQQCYRSETKIKGEHILYMTNMCSPSFFKDFQILGLDNEKFFSLILFRWVDFLCPLYESIIIHYAFCNTFIKTN